MADPPKPVVWRRRAREGSSAEHLSTTTDVVRAAAAGMGCPIKEVRMADRSTSAGLRWDECPSPAPADPLRVSSEQVRPPTTTRTTPARKSPERGVAVRRTDGGLIIYDLADTHRRRGVVGG
jgi:hypothetical protein